MVTSLAIIAHEVPQEVSDFFVLLHSGYSRRKAFLQPGVEPGDGGRRRDRLFRTGKKAQTA